MVVERNQESCLPKCVRHKLILGKSSHKIKRVIANHKLGNTNNINVSIFEFKVNRHGVMLGVGGVGWSKEESDKNLGVGHKPPRQMSR